MESNPHFLIFIQVNTPEAMKTHEMMKSSSIPRGLRSSIGLACSIHVAVAFEEMSTHFSVSGGGVMLRSTHHTQFKWKWCGGGCKGVVSFKKNIAKTSHLLLFLETGLFLSVCLTPESFRSM